MKKIYLSMLVMLCVLSGCSKAPNNGNNENNENKQGDEIPQTEFLYGRVVGVVGNEVEIALANKDGLDLPETPDIKVNVDGSMDAVAMFPAGTPANSVVEEEPNLELTGETIKITIPTGTTILFNGQEGNLSNIKKGDILGVSVDNKSDLNINEIIIVK